MRGREKRRYSFRTKVRMAGLIIILIGMLIAIFDAGIKRTEIGLYWLPVVLLGVAVIGFSLKNSTKKKISKGLGLDPCQCCKCTNCGRDHNHWTH